MGCIHLPAICGLNEPLPSWTSSLLADPKHDRRCNDSAQHRVLPLRLCPAQIRNHPHHPRPRRWAEKSRRDPPRIKARHFHRQHAHARVADYFWMGKRLYQTQPNH